MSDEVLEGGCLCGAVRYRAEGPPMSNSTCHCRSCRLASGAAATAYFKLRRARFGLMRGTLQRYRSSPSVERGFCARCGTTLTYAHDEDPDDIQVTTATLDTPETWPPTHEVWLSHRIPWASSDGTIPRYADGDTEVGPDTP